MGTWIGVIVEAPPSRVMTSTLAPRLEPTPAFRPDAVHTWVGTLRWDPAGLQRVALELSSELQVATIWLLAQTSSDAYGITAYRDGQEVRVLHYSKDHGRWYRIEGQSQPFEHAFFFDGDGRPGPIPEELSDDRVAELLAALPADPSAIFKLVEPTSMDNYDRVVRWYGIDPTDTPDVRWKGRPSWWRRILGQR